MNFSPYTAFNPAEMDLSTLTDDNVLFFIRIRGKQSYFHNVYTTKFLSQFQAVKEFRCISEYAKDADVHIDLNKVSRDWLLEDEYAEFARLIDINEVILRCRGLRSSTYALATRLVFRTFLFFRDLFRSRPQLRLIVTGAVDNYVMDIMHRVGLAHGVAFLGVTDSFMSPEFKLVTVRGEATKFSTVPPAQVEAVYSALKVRALSPSVPKRARALRSAVYDLGSYVYRCVWRYLILHKMLGKLGYEYVFAPELRKFSSLDQLYAVTFLRNFDQVFTSTEKKYAYIPLHYYPEATTDYWIDDLYHVDYLRSVKNTVRQLRAQGYHVVAKEHPAFYLARFSHFYKELIAEGCEILTPFVGTVRVLAAVDLVVVWNGSTGIEAIIHGKPLVKVTNSYYGDNVIPNFDGALKPLHPTDNEGRDVVQKVLETSFRTV